MRAVGRDISLAPPWFSHGSAPTTVPCVPSPGEQNGGIVVGGEGQAGRPSSICPVSGQTGCSSSTAKPVPPEHMSRRLQDQVVNPHGGSRKALPQAAKNPCPPPTPRFSSAPFSSFISPTSQTSWPPGTECVAKYNFQGTTEQDLPFSKGDVLTIIGVTKDPNWYKARNPVGREGAIPANYVQKREGVKSGGKLSLMP
ncbi:tyrosine-protein kinase CSK-like [Scleropages formosus]|uniref:Tyrosine-protein kinase CSK-like n=1 Tax=Scleropages formosus TaxID=113540 RepID=A0A0P7XAA1_SCLFO|nr:tyrosine-protein kinase CSK-like [Scleropages formosus]